MADCHQWGPICRKTGRRVCAYCCYKCEHHISWSGIWQCGFKDRETIKAETMKRIQDRFNNETAKISEAYRTRKKEEAKVWAIKQARMRKK